MTAKLPLLLSVPHAGTKTPPEVSRLCRLTKRQIIEDGDEHAAAIYWPLAARVQALLTTDIARAIIDLNRAEDDRRADGVVKTHTCWNIPVYRRPLPELLAQKLLSNHYRPYHKRLRRLAAQPGLRLAIDCHTMVAEGPPISPDPGRTRPMVCLSDGEGACPRPWIEAMAACLAEAFDGDVKINAPFKGGFITRQRYGDLPWMQLELSRSERLSNEQKRQGVLQALESWCVTFAAGEHG